MNTDVRSEKLKAFVKVLIPFELPPGVVREKGEKMTMTLETAQGYGDKVEILRTSEGVK